jgi:uncharacterized protein involved in exopolysaccharide biosynthesis
MKRLVRLAVWLYPAWWRQRYGSEFEALLEDVKPGWGGLFDVLNGAVAMQMKIVGMIPVVCALTGALVGGIVALRTPKVFASSATIRLNAPGVANAASPTGQDLKVSVEKALGASTETRKATVVTLHRDDSAQTTLRLTYLDRDPAQAQRIAEKLTAAIATENASTEVIASPVLPTSPVERHSPMTVATGGGVGLVAGGVVLLFLRYRRRPGDSG